MKKQKSLIALLICLAFCLISMFGTWSMLTCNGTVEVNDLKISTSKGDLVRFLEYRPKTATADNPVPAIVYSPGNDSTAESVRLCSSELARRGYAVYVLDLLSAGHSSEGIGNSPTFGFEELIDRLQQPRLCRQCSYRHRRLFKGRWKCYPRHDYSWRSAT